MAGLKIVFGTAGFNPDGHFPNEAAVRPLLDLLEDLKVTTLDTAQLYGNSETLLGQVKAADRFAIDTKALGGFDPDKKSLEPDVLYKGAHESLRKLGTKQVDIFYIHAPEPTKSAASWVPTIDKLHKEGVFKRFGLSNFLPKQVQEVYDAAKEGGYILPTAYQGNYSPVTRLQETELFPLLRKLGISFYAYSPLAGGFLTKTKEQLVEGKDAGRFSNDKSSLAELYRGLYYRPAYLEALKLWAEAAEEEGVPKAELAYRWVSYHSPLSAEAGDAIIFGGRNLEQAEQTLRGLGRGPLKPAAVKRIDEIWETIKHEAPLDNYNS